MLSNLYNSEYFTIHTYENVLELVTKKMINPAISSDFQEIHSRMLDEAIKRKAFAVDYVKSMIRQIILEGLYRVEGLSLDQLVTTLFRDMYGLGPIEDLLLDPEVQEINVNGADSIWYEKKGQKKRAHIAFASDEHLKQIIDRCLPNKEVNRLEAFAQASLDKSRIYVGIPPVAKRPYLNYRRFTVFNVTEEAYLNTGTLTKEALEMLKYFVEYRANIMIIGPQNTGKTTLLSFLTDFYPADFRIGVLESNDFETEIESRRPLGNVFSLKTDEKLRVKELDIFKHALRFSADVLLIPEARGAEMEEVLKAQRRGNRGSMSTIHSISPAGLVDDIMLMITESGKPYQLDLLRMMVAKSLDIVITMHRDKDGSRRVVDISEVDYNDKKGQIVVRDIFTWDKGGLVRTGNVLGDELVHSMQFYGAAKEDLLKWGLIK